MACALARLNTRVLAHARARGQDLVHWQLVDHAIEPTAGSVDSDGCFSGCAAIDADGTPCLLYTGVRGGGGGGALRLLRCALAYSSSSLQLSLQRGQRRGKRASSLRAAGGAALGLGGAPLAF